MLQDVCKLMTRNDRSNKTPLSGHSLVKHTVPVILSRGNMGSQITTHRRRTLRTILETYLIWN